MKNLSVGFHIWWQIGRTTLKFETPWRWRTTTEYADQNWSTSCHRPEVCYVILKDYEWGWFKIHREIFTPEGLEAERRLDEEIENMVHE